jgi:lipase
VRLNVYEWGDPQGAPVVCLHGLTGWGGRYARLARERLADRRVVAFDLRGHGRSGWDAPWDIDTHVADMAETADALGIRAGDWVGHSYGGRLVAELAAREPGRVERAVLLDPAMQIAPEVVRERSELLRSDTSFATVDEAIDTRLSDPTLLSTPRATIEEEAAGHLEQGADGRWRWRFCPPMAIVAWSEMATPPPPWPSCPTLLVLGARSWIPNDASGAAQVEVATVPGGHVVLWDDYEATADAVERFLRA